MAPTLVWNEEFWRRFFFLYSWRRQGWTSGDVAMRYVPAAETESSRNVCTWWLPSFPYSSPFSLDRSMERRLRFIESCHPWQADGKCFHQFRFHFRTPRADWRVCVWQAGLDSSSSDWNCFRIRWLLDVYVHANALCGFVALTALRHSPFLLPPPSPIPTSRLFFWFPTPKSSWKIETFKRRISFGAVASPPPIWFIDGFFPVLLFI